MQNAMKFRMHNELWILRFAFCILHYVRVIQTKAPLKMSLQRGFLWIGGGYLLSHFRSTIGAAGFNFSVRNGKRWNPRAMAALVLFAVSAVFMTVTCIR